MWTATVQQVYKIGDPRVKVVFTDGVQPPIEQDFMLGGHTEETLKIAIETKRQSLEKTFTLAEAIGPAFDLATAEIPVVNEGRVKFFADFAKLQRYKALVDAGALDANSKEYLELQALVRSELDLNYFS